MSGDHPTGSGISSKDIREILADGKQHKVRAIVNKLKKKIRPERASQMYIKDAARESTKILRRKKPFEVQVAEGNFVVVMSFILSLRRHHGLITTGRGKNMVVQLPAERTLAFAWRAKKRETATAEVSMYDTKCKNYRVEAHRSNYEFVGKHGKRKVTWYAFVKQGETWEALPGTDGLAAKSQRDAEQRCTAHALELAK